MATATHGRSAVQVPSRLPAWVGRAWLAVRSHRSIGVVVAIGLAAGLALLSSIPMPRGPVTSSQGLAVILLSVLVGLAAGYVMRSRWALLVAPVAYIVAYELARTEIRGASLEGFRFDTTYGIAAFVVGRGFHGLLALLPMVLGASIGVSLARGPAAERSWRRRVVGQVPHGLLTAAVIGLALVVAMPASTPPVYGADGNPVAGSVAELTTVELGGAEQAISIRAADPDDPVLLYLSGGPGQSDLAFARALLEPLERDFVVVAWDQRGSGRSYGALDPTSDLTLEQAVADTIELSEYLRTRFDEEAIYLLGESWGTTLGVLAAQQRPDLYHAYIGSGQMVSQRQTDRIIWRDLLAWAQEHEDGALYDEVLTLGEPPYRDTPWANSLVMGYYGVLETSYEPPQAYIERGESSAIGPFGVLGSEYGFVDKANVIRGLVDMFSLMYPQLQDIDFREDVPRLEVPVVILDGAHELRGRRSLAHEWFEALEAPDKRLVTYEDAGHSVVFEQADAFSQLMVEEVVPLTYDTGQEA